MSSVIPAYRFRMVLALLAAGLAVAVVVVAAIVLIEAMAAASPGTSGDYGPVY